MYVYGYVSASCSLLNKTQGTCFPKSVMYYPAIKTKAFTITWLWSGKEDRVLYQKNCIIHYHIFVVIMAFPK